jgi:hypothetical protein
MRKKLNKAAMGVSALIAVFLFSSSFLTFANLNSYFEAPPIEWNRTYGEGAASSALQIADGNYILAGEFGLIKTDSSGNLIWKKVYGSEAGFQSAYSVVQTRDLGYAMSGYRGWLFKTDSEGNVEWNKLFGVESSVLFNADGGGFVLVGNLITNSGEVALLKIDESGNLLWNITYGEDMSWMTAAVKTNDGEYVLTGDYGGLWVAKLDSNGDLLSKKNYDVSNIGVFNGYGGSITETSDGGYIISGTTKKSYYVPFLIKIDSKGTMQWIQKYEDGANFHSVVQLKDGGYLASGAYFRSDILSFFVRTDSSGNLRWETSYGLHGNNGATLVNAGGGEFVAAGALNGNIWLAKFGPESKVPIATYPPPAFDWFQSYKEYAVSAAIQTADGGYAIAGVNASGGDYRGYGVYSPLLIKTNYLGEFEWKRVFGKDTGVDGRFNSIAQTQDGGYLLSGTDWLLKTDAKGNISWIKTYERIARVSSAQIADGGFALVGITDAVYPNSSDTVFIKTDGNGNPLWNITFSSGRPYKDVWAYQLMVTSEKGYAIAGTWGGTDFWFAKIDSNGNLKVNLTYSSITSDSAVLNSVSETADKGFILAGTEGYSRHRAWLIKTDTQGISIWTYHFEDLQKGGTFNSVAQTRDGGYVAGGSELVKVDSAGKLKWNASYSPTFLMINREGRIVIGYGDNGIWLVQFAEELNIAQTPSPSIPEFPTWPILVAVLIIMTLAAVAIKRRSVR